MLSERLTHTGTNWSFSPEQFDILSAMLHHWPTRFLLLGALASSIGLAPIYPQTTNPGDVFNSNSGTGRGTSRSAPEDRFSGKDTRCADGSKHYEKQRREQVDEKAASDERNIEEMRQQLNGWRGQNPEIRSSIEKHIKDFAARAARDRQAELKQHQCYQAYYARGCVGRPCSATGGSENPGSANGGTAAGSNPPMRAPVLEGNKTAAFPGWDYLRGMALGMGDCVRGGQDALGALALMFQGDFVTAAQMLGLEPGKSVTLKTIYQELTTNVSFDPQTGRSISAEEAGRIAGRRICAYGIVPGATKIAGEAIKALGPAGNSMFKPVAPANITPNVENLAGKWIKTKNGPVKLGVKRSAPGKSMFGVVYDAAEKPGQVIKISKPRTARMEDPAETFPRQQSGTDLLEKAGIPTPRILDIQRAVPGQRPALLWIEDAFKKWPGATLAPDVLSTVHLDAVKKLYDSMGNAGLVWGDGHQGNVVFIPKPGGLAAGVLDSDMIVKASEMGAAPEAVANRLLKALMKMKRGELILSNDARPIMNTLFEARYLKTSSSSLTQPLPRY